MNQFLRMESLTDVSPAALVDFARSVGWTRREAFGDFSDVYVGNDLPEIILPRTQELGDYSSIVMNLLDIFAEVVTSDIISLYQVLITSDRDVISVHVSTRDHDSDLLSVSEGIDLISGARDMIQAAACSLEDRRPLYRLGANKNAVEYMRRVVLDHTRKGSFVVRLLSPVVPPFIQSSFGPEFGSEDVPLERQVTIHLSEILNATREATDHTVRGNYSAFLTAVNHGVSANLCEAVVQVLGQAESMSTTIVWAHRRPTKHRQASITFSRGDKPILVEAARQFRSRLPREGELVVGVVERLRRETEDVEGSISLSTLIDNKRQSVIAVLNEADYHTAILAHREKLPVAIEGDLERVGHRWRLLYPKSIRIMRSESEHKDPGSPSTIPLFE